MSEYFIRRNRIESGPFNSDQLRAMARNNELQPNDSIRKGTGPWIPAANIKGLLGNSGLIPVKLDSRPTVPSIPAFSQTNATPPPLPTNTTQTNAAFYDRSVPPDLQFKQIGNSPNPNKKIGIIISIIIAGLFSAGCLAAFAFIMTKAGSKEIAKENKKEPNALFAEASKSLFDKKKNKNLDFDINGNSKIPPELIEKIGAFNEKVGNPQDDLIKTDKFANSDIELESVEKPELAIDKKLKNVPIVQQTQMPREKMIEKAIGSVALINREKKIGLLETRSVGSGFLVSSNIVATNRHVAGEAGEVVKVRFPSAKGKEKSTILGVVISSHSERDIALVRLAATPNIAPLIVGFEGDCKPGQELIAIGNPSDGFNVMENAVRVGNFSSIKEVSEKIGGKVRSMLELGISINGGNSGGPVLDSNGRVVGLITLKSTSLEAMAFAEPSSELINLAKATIPGKIIAKKGPIKPNASIAETNLSDKKSFGINLNFSIKAKVPLDKSLFNYYLSAQNQDGISVAKGSLQSPGNIIVGQKAMINAWIPINDLSVLSKISSFVLEKKPDERETNFAKQLTDFLKAGNIQECKNIMADFDLAWKDHLILICDEFKNHQAPSTRSALLTSISCVATKIPELKNQYYEFFSESDVTVLKTAVESVLNLDEVDAKIMDIVFNLAIKRDDMIAKSANIAITKTLPLTNEMANLYANKFDSNVLTVQKSIIASFKRSNVDSAISLPIINKSINSNDISLRLLAIDYIPKLIESSRDESLSLLLSGIIINDASVISEGLKVIPAFEPFKKQDVETLTKYLPSLQPDIQEQICKALYSLGTDNAFSESELVKLTRSISPKVACAAIEALSVNLKIRNNSITTIKEFIKNANPVLRTSAANALGNINRTCDAVSDLFDMLGDTNRDVSESARIALGKMSPQIGIDDIEILKDKINHKNDSVRRMAFHVLAEIGKDASGAKGLVNSGLSDKDSMIVYDVMRILDNINDTDIELAKKATLILEKSSVGISKQKSSAELKPAVQTFDGVYETISPSVAIVRLENGSGSGFLVAPRLIVTNKHVSEYVGEHSLVQFPSAKKIAHLKIPAINVWVHPYRDLAVIQLSIDPALPILHLRPESELRPGQEIISIGSPGIPGGTLVQNSIRKGTFSSIQNIPGEGRVIELDLSVNSGNSGGPVIDQTGHVFGVVTFGFRNKERMTFAEPISEILPILKNQAASPKAAIPQKQNDDKANPILMQRNSVNHVDTSIVALNYLAKFGPDAKFSLPVLRKVLQLGTSLEMHKAAMHVVSNMKENAVTLIPDLIKKFDYPGRIGFQATNLAEYRRIFLENKNNQMIREAIASIGAPAASELAKILYSNEPAERFGALITLQSMNENAKDAMASIYRITVSNNERSPLVLQQARETYGRLEPLTKTKK